MQVHGNKENRATEISEISRNLKALARELNVPIIALSQLNEVLNNELTKYSNVRFRESGAIEQDASYRIIYLRGHDPETDKKGIAQINVAKQRNGAIGKFNLTWVGRYTKFENWSPEYEQF